LAQIKSTERIFSINVGAVGELVLTLLL